MVCVDRDLLSGHVVRQVIHRLGNLVVGGHTALMDYARLSDLHHRSVCSRIDGIGFLNYSRFSSVVDIWRRQ